MQVVKGKFRLGPAATDAAIGAAISETMDAARKAFGDKPNRALLVIDRTGYNTVVRAMITPMVVA